MNLTSNPVFTSYQVLVGNTLGDSAYVSSSIAEPDPTRVLANGQNEVLWVSGTTYAVDDRRILTTTHRVYRDTVGGVSNVSPSADPTRWVDEGPTNRWAWNDSQVSTRTSYASPYVLTVRPGAISHIGLAGMEDVASIRVRMWDAPAGTLVHDETYGNEDVQGLDPHWALYFQAPVYGYLKIISGLPVHGACQVELTLTGYASTVAVGLVAFGTVETMGAAEVGAELAVRDYGYTTTDKWGNAIRTPGAKGADLRVSGKVPVQQANALRNVLFRLVDVGAIHIPSSRPEYAWLTTWGILKPATMRAEDAVLVGIDFEVEGFI